MQLCNTNYFFAKKERGKGALRDIIKPERSNAWDLCKLSKIFGKFLVNINIVFS